jgi:hypothetical protein
MCHILTLSPSLIESQDVLDYPLHFLVQKYIAHANNTNDTNHTMLITILSDPFYKKQNT